MQLRPAAALARQLMKQHGLRNWTFVFDRARRRFGTCEPTRRRITLSRHLTLLNDEQEVRDTILHEIAHALTPGTGHGPQWQAACRQVGARPVRCFRPDEVAMPPRRSAPYQIGCRHCQWWQPRYRLTASQLVCRRCRHPVIYRHVGTGELFSIAPDGRLCRLAAEPSSP